MPENVSNSGDLNSMLRSYANATKGGQEDYGVKQEEIAPVADEQQDTSDQTTEVVNQQDESGADNSTSTLEDKGTSDAATSGEKKIEKLPVKKDDGAKKAKEVERQDRSWKAYQEKIAAFKKEQEDSAAKAKAERDEIARAKAEADAYVAQKRKEAEEASVAKDTEFTPEQWEEAAERWEAAGRVDDARLAKQQAKAARAKQGQANQIKTQKQIEAAKAEAQKWDGKALEEFPELKDKKSEFYEEVKKIYMGQSDINRLPRGLYLTADYVKNKVAASKVPELEKQIGELKEQLKVANQKLTSPGGTSSQGGNKDVNTAKSDAVENMSLDQKLKAYNRVAQYQ